MNGPRVMVARWRTRCAGCEHAIMPGERIEWRPVRMGPSGRVRGASRHFPGCATDARSDVQREQDRDDAALAQYERDALGEW